MSSPQRHNGEGFHLPNRRPFTSPRGRSPSPRAAPPNSPVPNSPTAAATQEGEEEVSNPPDPQSPSSTAPEVSGAGTRYTWKERLFMVKTYWKNEDNWRAVVDAWPFIYPDKEPPSRTAIRGAVRQLEEHGNVDYNYKGRTEATVVTDKLVEDIRNNSIRETTMPPHVVRSSTRRHEFQVPQWTYHRALKKGGLWAYKMWKVQRLARGHDMQRIVMCNYLRQRSDNWFKWMISIDESMFDLDGTVNSQNHREYLPKRCGGSPTFKHMKRSQGPQVHILAGVVGNGTKLPVRSLAPKC